MKNSKKVYGIFAIAAILIIALICIFVYKNKNNPISAPSNTPVVVETATPEPTNDPIETVQPTVEPTSPVETVTPTEDPVANEQIYILNTNTMKFHRNTCEDGQSIKEDNKQVFIGDRSDILADGYVPCKKCNP